MCQKHPKGHAAHTPLGDYKGVPSPPVASPAPPAGGYGSYGTYKPPAGGYGSYKGYKREDAGPEGPVEDEA